MGVVLPDELAWVLDLIGVNWPNVDEDEFRDMADSLRTFADQIDDGNADSLRAVQRMISENVGPATDAFAAHWDKISGKHLHNLAEAGRLLATGLDGGAMVIAGAKVAAIAQLVIMATEVIAAQAAAPFTFGLSEAGALGATQATRLIVKRLLKEAEQQIVSRADGRGDSTNCRRPGQHGRRPRHPGSRQRTRHAEGLRPAVSRQCGPRWSEEHAAGIYVERG
ncbi:hypothetical protein ACFQ2M_14075 [Kitasatospora saccharophila]|uniref:WXG100-like domain-containing protein n=1 Tax=Kitasatospora saccharophila TaxID=407973 RepID=UPI00364301A3